MKHKIEKLDPKYQKVLFDIQKSVPQEWLNAVTVREPLAPVTIEILQRAIEDPEVPQAQKDKAQLILDSGVLNKEMDNEVPEVAMLIDAFIEKEVAKAISLKRLPKLPNAVPFDVAFKRFNDLKTKYENRSTK